MKGQRRGGVGIITTARDGGGGGARTGFSEFSTLEAGLVWVGLGWAAEKIGPVPRLSALSFTCPPRCLLRTKKRTGEGENPFNFFSPSSAASCGNDPFRGRGETVPYDKRLFAPLFLYSGIP